MVASTLSKRVNICSSFYWLAVALVKKKVSQSIGVQIWSSFSAILQNLELFHAIEKKILFDPIYKLLCINWEVTYNDKAYEYFLFEAQSIADSLIQLEKRKGMSKGSKV